MLFRGKTKKQMIAKIAISCCCLFVVLLFYLSLRPQKEDTPTEAVEGKGLTLFNASYEEWDKDKRAWMLEAAQIFQSKDGKNIDFQGIKKIILFQEDERSLSLTAARAKMDLRKDLLTLTEVQGFMTEGEFITDEIIINTRTKKVTCAKKISFAKEGLKLEANQMEGDYESEEYLFSGNLKVEQKSNRSRGELFRYYAKDDRFELQGKVEVELEL